MSVIWLILLLSKCLYQSLVFTVNCVYSANISLDSNKGIISIAINLSSLLFMLLENP